MTIIISVNHVLKIAESSQPLNQPAREVFANIKTPYVPLSVILFVFDQQMSDIGYTRPFGPCNELDISVPPGGNSGTLRM